ncbi:efflux RND transporter periplasmic adaptor subunit [Vagococcus humatus]|uniref:YknX-like beta-barrel domain-containing protein n=1 Tax=Vagococcus humatus TaxID=1889241 RepID=A0A3R9YFG4_9ENTE|nr:HlyD family efflux transporter periplasmic adaptor subunit [Vagococcus humatus]RST89957.1 hypothetical protein C7P63_02445 [Vagococcus humatus]
MKKRTKIIIGIISVLVLGCGIYLVKHQSKPKEQAAKDENNIEYYNIDGVDQVFINGTITPVKSQEFVKDQTLGKLGDLQVKNGDVVKEGTVLYQYVDPTSDKEIAEMKMNIQRAQAEKEKAIRQKQLELTQLNQGGQSKEEGEEAPQPNLQLAREEIELKYDISGMDMNISQMNQQLNEIYERQVNKVVAPFTGKVSIPQDKNRDSAILNLISEEFYVVGTVNEKDVTKIKTGQDADIKTISTNQSLKGKITYVSELPDSGAAPGEAGGMNGGGSSLSNYTVKLSLENPKNIKNGFHVQAAVNLSDKNIEIPKEAIHFDKSDAPYVFVDDFGTVLKKPIEIKETKEALGKKVVVLNGLESMDQVIVKSDKKLKDGDILTTGDTPNSTDDEVK